MCLFKKDEFRYNYKSKHIGFVKKKKKKKYTSVFMSTKEYDEGRKNLSMEKNIDLKSTEKSYFLTRIRSYPKNTYGPKLKNLSFTKNDRKMANALYKMHSKNSKMMKRKKRKKRNRYHS